MRKRIVIVAAVVTLGGLAIYQNQRRLERQRELVFRRVAACQQSSPDFGNFSLAVEKARRLPTRHGTETTSNIARLRPGTSFAQAEQLLGKPDFIDAGVPKDGDEYYGCDWTYLLDGKIEDGSLVMTDQLELRFDSADHLKEWSRTDEYGNPKH